MRASRPKTHFGALLLTQPPSPFLPPLPYRTRGRDFSFHAHRASDLLCCGSGFATVNFSERERGLREKESPHTCAADRRTDWPDCFLNQISGGLSAQDWSGNEHSISGGIIVQDHGYRKIMVPQGS
ncbi:hypothetical protein CDAR_205791 [Caerostris darwini]|uniref:Uncharacterized protein n=1 Tax=Caerostris darwini TaxID=1538125 RepID=A0AAV4WZ75_9ARAC|nr:hypothetical protein CDAR_205791 [Caerostris darwini]